MDTTGRPGSEVGAENTAVTWDPDRYLLFAGERARPFADLLARVDVVSPRAVVDLGCGTGALTAALARRWPSAEVTGIDPSAEMLAQAAGSAVPGRLRFAQGTAQDWRPERPVDVLVANAVLHWIPGHELLLHRWAGALAPGGTLAVQLPGNFRAPTHTLLAELCRSPRWAPLLAGVAPRADAVLEPAGYLDVLEEAGLAADVWETTYLHVLDGPDPVLRWVSGTVLRPALARLAEQEAAELTAAYGSALAAAYPPRPDGTTVLPFRRVFLVGRRPRVSGG